jgi:hypothetical protein
MMVNIFGGKNDIKTIGSTVNMNDTIVIKKTRKCWGLKCRQPDCI